MRLPNDPASDPTAHADLMAWRGAYTARLAAPDGWWALTSLAWLDATPLSIGSRADADVRLAPTAPAATATVTRAEGAVLIVPAAAGALWEGGTAIDGPVRVAGADRLFAAGAAADAARFAVLTRGTRTGVRAYDPRQAVAPERGVGWFDVASGWVLPARFTPATAGERVAIVNVLGDVDERLVAGRLRFLHAGTEHTLVATQAGDRLFVNFRDTSNGRTTYGAGRFLTVDAPVDGVTWLDFHRAHHPPCAHTAFATCPLPPLENRLPFAVAAGERLP